MEGGSDDSSDGEHNMDQRDPDPCDAAIATIVYSPVDTSIEFERDSSMIKELIGRLGNICNSGDDSFGGYSYTAPPNNTTILGLPKMEHVVPGRLSRYSSIREATVGSRNGNSSENGELGDSTEGTSISEQVPLLSVMNPARRWKFISPGKAKESPATSSAKIREDFGDKKIENDNAETLKDYIHVRARRGQATDRHSLGERVRREKISQRMKVIQGLVPGCNKVTGKAVMLDEIINYVQSLQRQVEFLSMKLATLSPRMDFNIEALVSKEMSNPLGSSFFSVDPSSSVFPYDYQPHQVMHSQGALGSNTEKQMDWFCEASFTEVSGLWEDELHSIVQMGIPPNQPPSQRLRAGQMKIEL